MQVDERPRRPSRCTSTRATIPDRADDALDELAHVRLDGLALVAREEPAGGVTSGGRAVAITRAGA